MNLNFTLVAQAITFALFIWFTVKFVWPPLLRAIETRQKQRSPIEQWFLRVTGLSMKMEQYVLGEAFVRHVVEARGVDFLNRVWSGPEALPTEDELRDPPTWITRVEAVAA